MDKLLGAEDGRASMYHGVAEPPLSSRRRVIGMEFEVAALLDYGPPGQRKSRYLGSVKWGWTRTATGKSDVKTVALAVVHKSGVSDAFKAAGTHWNTLTVTDPSTGTVYPVMPLATA